MTRAVTLLVLLALLAGCQFLTVRSTPLPRIRDLKDPKVGVSYELAVSTHCGLQSALIDGDVWVPEGGTVAREGGNFDFNVDPGTVVLTDSDHAVYTSSGGTDVPLKRTQGVPPSFPACI
jgi:hypothetical protein